MAARSASSNQTNLPPAFSRWLKRLRAQHDLTQEALAEKMFCSVQTIRFFEAGKRRPSLEMAERLIEVLHVPPEQREEFLRQARAPLDAEGEDVGASAAPPAEKTPAGETAPAAPPLRVPLPPTPLIGRQAEAAVLHRLLGEGRRLISLVGPGGIGKTRLALQVAHDLGERYADGAAFVSLAALSDAASIPAAVADALNLPLAGSGEPGAQLVALLATRSLLLVLDNFEHLLNSDNLATPGQVSAIDLLDLLLQQARGVQLLVTTRERLRLQGEHVFELTGLAVPSPINSQSSPNEIVHSDAVMLFLARAQQVQHHFALTPANQATIVRICRMLDGSPLGIELAASWVRALAVEEILDEMERNINFLTLTDRSAPARHRSLRAVFDHSWALLTEQERTILARLALFRGGFDRAAARAVADAGLPQLAALIDKSLIRTTPAADGGLRYEIHELLRQYLLDNLRKRGEESEIARRHAHHFVTFAEQIEPHLRDADSAPWQRRMDAEHGNLSAAFQWCVVEKQDGVLGLRLAAALGYFWYLAGRWKEGCDYLQMALALEAASGSTVQAEVRARALIALGELHRVLSEHDAAFAALQEGLTIWRATGDRANTALALFQLGRAISSRGNFEQALIYLDESLAIYREINNTWGIATLLNQIGSIAVNRGEYTLAAQLLEEAVPALRALQRRGGIITALNLWGRAVLAEGNAERAIELFREALEVALERQGQEGLAWTEFNLGLAYIAAQQPVEAANHLCSALDIYRELDSKGGLMAVFAAMSAVALAQNDLTRAAQLLAASDRLMQQIGEPFTIYEAEMHKRTQEQIRARMSPEAWKSAWTTGHYLPLAQAIALVLA